MAKHHPYIGLPDYQFWKKEPAIEAPELFDPIVRVSFRIDRADPVVTAGSCFAQHVARHLANSGFNFLVTEKAHSIVHADVVARNNYGAFSARYGNIYTSRQLKQLLLRAYGQFTPIEDCWKIRDAMYVDPFRPQIQENGFASPLDLHLDREVHFKAIRDAVEAMSVFVFTLGLTECWMDRRDGAVFPLAPGVAGGDFDENIHKLVNLTVGEITDDISFAINFIRRINPKVKMIFTVSPVPLNATAIDRHVFVSTTYSKSVLRVAAEEICNRFEMCDYFPSYEIITSPYSRGQYYAPDRRNIAETGVSHVMSLFLRHYGAVGGIDRPNVQNEQIADGTARFLQDMEQAVDVLCDEERITNQ